MVRSKEELSVLHIILAVTETSAPYNEHCLPWAERRDITVCTYFASDVVTPKTISLFEGDGSLTGFFAVLQAALAAKEYDIIHAHSPHVGLLFLLGTFFSLNQYARSTVITVHDSYPNFKIRNRLMWIPIFAAFRQVVCCSKASYDSFPAFFKAIAGKRLMTAQNGLDIDRVDRTLANATARRISEDTFTVVAISRLVDIKNPATLLAAFQESANGPVRESRLVHIGKGPLRERLLRESQRTDSKGQIEFTGLIPRERVFEHLRDSDLFISTSRGEGLPIAVMEAMACRCPVVLSDIPPHREIAGSVAFIPLIDPDDVAGFAREIRKFRTMPASERRVIGEKCRKLVEERFSLEAMHARYNEIYARLTQARVLSPLAVTK